MQRLGGGASSHSVHMWRSEDNLQDSVLSFHRVEWDGAWDIRLGSRQLALCLVGSAQSYPLLLLSVPQTRKRFDLSLSLLILLFHLKSVGSTL